MLGETTSRRGILDPEAARRHYRLTRYAPSPDLAHLVERHWIVEWDLREPFTQELVTHPCVNLVFEAHVALIHGVITGRGREGDRRPREGGRREVPSRRLPPVPARAGAHAHRLRADPRERLRGRPARRGAGGPRRSRADRRGGALPARPRRGAGPGRGRG